MKNKARRISGWFVSAAVLALAAGSGAMAESHGLSGTIAFVSDHTGNDELFLLNLSDRSVHQLTDSPGFDRAPSWNPSGDALVFNSRREPHEDRPQVYLLELTDGKLTRIAESEAEQHRAAFSSHGQSVYYQQGAFMAQAFNLMRHDFENGTTTAVTAAADPAVWNAAASPSPDGRWLVWQSNAHLDSPEGPFPQVLHVMELETGVVTVVDFAGSDLEGASIDGPRWSPDSRWLTLGSGGSIQIVDTRAGEPGAWQPVQLTAGPDDSAPVFSPDGNWIAYQESGEVDYLIKAIHMETAEVVILAEGCTPVWTERVWTDLSGVGQ